MGRAWLILCLIVGTAAAQPDEAKRHFDRGRELYDQGQYQQAMSEFTRARTLLAAPAFDYNIGRCLEQLGRWAEAADAYERYLPSAGEGELPVLRALIGNLRQRQVEAEKAAAAAEAKPLPSPAPAITATAPPKKPIYKRGWFWGVLSGTVVVAVGVAVGVTLGTRQQDPSHSIMDVQF